MGSAGRIAWVIGQFKKQQLSDTEKLVLIALADYPAEQEYVIDTYALDPTAAAEAFTNLLLRGLVRYQEGAAYVYELVGPGECEE